MKVSLKTSLAIKSYWHGLFVAETPVVYTWVSNLVQSHGNHFNLRQSALGSAYALAAPVTREIVKKYPWIVKPFKKVMAKLGWKVALPAS